MSLVKTFVHLFLPHTSNNQKAKLLHNSSLLAITLLLLGFQLVISLLPKSGLKVLGYAANISPSEVVRLTNEKRAQAGLPPLTMNATLSVAAGAKGNDMLAKDYWAHDAPDGTKPWKFFSNAGYRYRYAGENLARDFSNPSAVVDAWMASPSHKDNLMSPKYKEIGVAVVEGDLAGADTTLVVQFFGSKYSDAPSIPVAKANTTATSKPKAAVKSETDPVALETLSPTTTPVATPKPFAIGSSNPTPTNAPEVLVSPFTTTRGVSLAVVGILLAVLVIDAILVSRRRIARIGGRTFAHIAFLGMIIAVILVLKAGKII